MFSNTSLISKSSKFLLGVQFLVVILLTLHIENAKLPFSSLAFSN